MAFCFDKLKSERTCQVMLGPSLSDSNVNLLHPLPDFTQLLFAGNAWPVAFHKFSSLHVPQAVASPRSLTSQPPFFDALIIYLSVSQVKCVIWEASPSIRSHHSASVLLHLFFFVFCFGITIGQEMGQHYSNGVHTSPFQLGSTWKPRCSKSSS